MGVRVGSGGSGFAFLVELGPPLRVEQRRGWGRAVGVTEAGSAGLRGLLKLDMKQSA
jgi:hypothetical protein